MPFVYDFESIEWPEDADDDFWPEPTPDEYQYLKPEAFGGTACPVSFIVPTQLQAATADGSKPTGAQRGLFSRMLRAVAGRTKTGRAAVQIADLMASMRGQSAEQVRQRDNLFCVAVPFLKQIGRQVVCSYDGGNDEGWAWFRSLKTADGSRDKAQLLAALSQTGLVAALRTAGLLYESDRHPRTDEQHLEELLERLAEEWGVMLLGNGFGTGPFQMYGAFTVDLEKLTIEDDPQAATPMGGNIRFPRSEDQRQGEDN